MGQWAETGAGHGGIVCVFQTQFSSQVFYCYICFHVCIILVHISPFLCHFIRNEVMIDSNSESAICALNRVNMYSLYNSQFIPPVEICCAKSVFARLR